MLSLVEGPGGDEGATELMTQLVRHITEWIEFGHVFGDTTQILIIKLILSIENGEHPLVEDTEKGIHRLRQPHSAFSIVSLEFIEEVAKNFCIVQVYFPIRPLKHAMELQFRIVHHVAKYFIKLFRSRLYQ